MGQAKAETMCISCLKAGLSLPSQGRFSLTGGLLWGLKGYGLLPGWAFTFALPQATGKSGIDLRSGSSKCGHWQEQSELRGEPVRMQNLGPCPEHLHPTPADSEPGGSAQSSGS